MGSVAKELSSNNPETVRSFRGCSACEWIANTDALDDEDRASIRAWIESGKPSDTLWFHLKRYGLPTGREYFRRFHCKEQHDG